MHARSVAATWNQRLRSPMALILGLVAPMSGLAWLASGAPDLIGVRASPEPEVLAIMEAAAEDGTYAYDAVSESANMRPREMIDGPYLMISTERRHGASPEAQLLTSTGADCVRLARALADFHGHLAFCERAF